MNNRRYFLVMCVLWPATMAWGSYLGRHLGKSSDEFWTAIYVASPAIVAVIWLVAMYLASRTKRSTSDIVIKK